jgi:hypothetical protein
MTEPFTAASTPPPTWRRRLRNLADDLLPQTRWLPVIGALLAIYLVAVIGLGLYWSVAPGEFDVREKAQR